MEPMETMEPMMSNQQKQFRSKKEDSFFSNQHVALGAFVLVVSFLTFSLCYMTVLNNNPITNVSCNFDYQTMSTPEQSSFLNEAGGEGGRGGEERKEKSGGFDVESGGRGEKSVIGENGGGEKNQERQNEISFEDDDEEGSGLKSFLNLADV